MAGKAGGNARRPRSGPAPDLAELIDQRAAISEILHAISRSRDDLVPLLDAVIQAAARFCNAPDVVLLQVDGDVLRGAAGVGEFADAQGQVGGLTSLEIQMNRQSVAGRAACDRRTILVHDLAAEPEDEYPMGRELQRRFGHHTVVATPLLRGSQLLGVIGLFRKEVQPFSDSQVELLQAFADEAAIAIENVRLFTEREARNRDLSEACEQQDATAEILRVISSSPTDVQPVFDTIAASALRLCHASVADVATFDGTTVYLAALANVSPAGAEALHRTFPRPVGRDSGLGRAILTKEVQKIADVLNDPEYGIADSATSSGFRSALCVPLLRDGNAVGAIAVGRREPGSFPDTQIALLRTFADQAVIAIESVRLFTELRARTAELTRSVHELRALGEIGQAVSSTLDVETVLRTIVSRASELAGMDGGAIFEYDEEGEEFHLRATDSLPAEVVDVLQAHQIHKGEGAIGRLALAAEPVQISDIHDVSTYSSPVRDVLVRLGSRSLLAVPLLRENHLLGGLVMNRNRPGDFAPRVIELLQTFATQSALAIQNARLYGEIEVKSRQLEAASRHKSEFLANMSHELRTPLNAIIGFSEVLGERMFGEINDKQAEYLNDILDSGRHLLSLINDILDLSKIEAGRMELDASDFDLRSAVHNTLILVRERAHRHGIALESNIADGVGKIHGDERKVRQVLLNLLSNALKFTPDGGRIDVGARVHDGVAEVSVADTGVGIAADDQAAVFEEFRQVGTTSKKVEGTGLGLAISRKFVELHGGRIWVTSEPGIGSTFVFTLPVAPRD